jgi:hypothetical protein
MRYFLNLYKLFSLLVFVLYLSTSLPAVGQSQEDTTLWDTPTNLFETTGRASEAEVVTDQSGIVHVFWAYGAPGDEDLANTQSIYYTRYKNNAWSVPIDVLVSPENRSARMQSVVADNQGYLHIVWSGGNALFYSRAFAPEAGSAMGWSTPLALTSNVGVGEPAIINDNDGGLFVVWTQAGNGLMFARSENSGSNWSNPQTIFVANQPNELARWGRIAVDEAGRLHVSLTHTVRLNVLQDESRNDPNYLVYLNSYDGGRNWSEPFQIAPDLDFGEVNVIAFGENTVHLVWNGRAGRHGRYHRLSEDGGLTWKNTTEILAPAPKNPIGDGGLTGFPALVTDATGTLHMVTATGGGDYYFTWNAGTWSQPMLISQGLGGSGVTNSTNSLEQPSIALSEGNRIHVVFHDGFERIWYTASVLNTPFQPSIELITPINILTTSVEANTTLSPLVDKVSTPAPTLSSDKMSPTSSLPFNPLFFSILSTGLFLIILIVIYISRHRN